MLAKKRAANDAIPTTIDDCNASIWRVLFGSKGIAERYKTTWEYDGTSQNPHWLGLKNNVPAA